MSITISQILEKVPLIIVFTKNKDILGILIQGLCLSIEDVFQGSLFVINIEDRKCIASALQLGAVAVLSTLLMAKEFSPMFPNIAFLYSTEILQSLVDLSVFFYPGQPAFMAAVTGTNGKTFTVNIARQIWGKLGYKAGSIGTLGVSMENCQPLPANFPSKRSKNFTTFEPMDFHKSISTMKQSEVELLALEATSQGIIKNRLDSVRFQVGVFTNFTRDHLDIHGSRENYFAAKCSLFYKLMLPRGIVIINNRLSEAELATLFKIASEKQLTVWTYGANFGDLHYRNIAGSEGETQDMLVISIGANERIVNLPEYFRSVPFFIENILAAIGIVIASGVNFEFDAILATLPFLKPIPGRLELVESPYSSGTLTGSFADSPSYSCSDYQFGRVTGFSSGSRIIIDAANNIGSFLAILPLIRSKTSGKLIVVFGCQGNQDPGKRNLLGHIASEYADYIIVTDDNSRNENPITIRKMILLGITKSSNNFEEIEGRRAAIKRGLSILGDQDNLLILGRGAEKDLPIGEYRIPFVDKEVIESIMLENKLKCKHEQMEII